MNDFWKQIYSIYLSSTRKHKNIMITERKLLFIPQYSRLIQFFASLLHTSLNRSSSCSAERVEWALIRWLFLNCSVRVFVSVLRFLFSVRVAADCCLSRWVFIWRFNSWSWVPSCVFNQSKHIFTSKTAHRQTHAADCTGTWQKCTGSKPKGFQHQRSQTSDWWRHCLNKTKGKISCSLSGMLHSSHISSNCTCGVAVLRFLDTICSPLVVSYRSGFSWLF